MVVKQMKTFNTGTTRYIITDAKAREDIAELQGQVAPLDVSAQSGDVGKALKAKTVANGKVTEYELGDAAIIDDTLSVAGEAADAKETGDAIAELDDAKVNKPATSPNGTSGQLLRTNGDGTTTWVDQGLPTDAQTADAVSAWLDDHPEATTTVQDGAITKSKLDSNLQDTVDDVADLKSQKVNINQGVAQAGKALVVGQDGLVTTGDAGISDAVKVSLLNLVRHVAYTDDQGQAYYDALYAALYQSPVPSSYPRLDVIYDNPSTITVDKSTMTKLDAYINNRHDPNDIASSGTCKTVYFPCQPNVTYRISKVLSARYRVGYTVDVPASGVTIYGVIADNEATTILLTTGSDARYVAVYYYDSANDTLPESTVYDSLEVTYGGHVVYTDDALDTLKPYLTVKRLESAGDIGTLVTDYTLSGTLMDGPSTVLVQKDGLSTPVLVTAVDFYNQMYYSLSLGSLTKLVAGAVTGDGTYEGNISASGLDDGLPGTRRSVWTTKGKKKITKQFTFTELDYYPIPIPDHATKAIVTVTPNTQYVSPRVFRLSDNVYTSMQIASWAQGTSEFTMNDIGTNDYLTVNMKYDSAGSSYAAEPTEVTVTFVR